ncbi:leucine-rich repeat domain-containing protein [Bacteroides faecis]|uniref:leucine-rich repeat domain-containing protein n=1 Tax=Bacteroides faecis TaxID=674529 RepID=UPI001F234492|nr:leucine-rich repeat domain-containing protein [Bacteroides faecis]MCE8942549.1 leucine-rich repeat domain-containing protein [Bacteroides faecis]
MKERILCSLKNISFVIIIALLGAACGDDKEESIDVGNEGGNGTVTGTVAKVDVKKAGSLSSLIGDDVKFNITDLTVTGDINGDDIALIREMAGADVNGDETKGHLSKLNLKDANIVAGGNPYYIRSTTQAYYSRTNVLTSYMFVGCNNLTTVIFPKAIEVIESCIFHIYGNNSSVENRNLTTVTLGDKIAEIGIGAFANCVNLKAIVIPDGVTIIGDMAFGRCLNLTTIDIPNTVSEIGDRVFEQCDNLATINMSNNIVNLGATFQNCTGLKNIKIPDSVTSIGTGAFMNCRNLVSLSIGCGLRYIGVLDITGGIGFDKIFFGCNSLVKFTVSEDNPNFISVDGMLLTKDKSRLVTCPVVKTKIDIPSSVTIIGGPSSYDDTIFPYRYYAYPFSYSSLTSVTIPANVRTIFGFNNCTQLMEVHIRCTTPPALPEAFIAVNDKCIFYVPRGTLDVYKKSEWWKYKNIVEE